uniref:Uncharacterized protein n=1 Tax=Fagus sylvatica TaxID=28930 RepID=A0A2N9HPL8_FAGSY
MEMKGKGRSGLRSVCGGSSQFDGAKGVSKVVKRGGEAAVIVDLHCRLWTLSDRSRIWSIGSCCVLEFWVCCCVLS